MGARMRAHDWSASPLGPPQGWPQALRAVVALMINSRFPMFVAWGPQLGFLYNDPYAEILGGKHPDALGRRFEDIWGEIWGDISPLIDAALSGEASFREDLPLLMNRKGYAEQTWFTFSYSPVRGDDGRIAGMFCACAETTGKVLAEAELKAERDQLSEMFEQAPGFIAMLEGPEHRFSLANASYRRLIGDRETLGRTVAEVLPEAAAQGFVGMLDRVYGTGETIRLDAAPVTLGHGAEAEQHFLDFIYQPVRAADGTVTGIFVEGQDVTARVRGETLRSLHNTVLELAIRDAPLGELLDELVRTVEGQSLAGMLGSILLLDADGRRLRHGAAPSLPEAYNAAIDGVEIGPGVGSCGTAAFTREPVYVSDIASDPLWADFRELAMGHGLRACWSTPIRSGSGEVLGTFAMYYREPREPAAQDLELIGFLARSVALVIGRKTTEAELRQSEARLRFLDRLATEATRSTGADEILAVTTRMVGEQLGVTSCAYADMDPDEDGFTIRGDWAAPGGTSIVGRYRLADFGRKAVEELGAGRPLIVNDNLAELAAEEAATFQALGIRATLCMPLIKDGRLTALMAVHHRDAHAWTAEELALLREVTERSWAHIERVGAEAEARESARQLGLALEAGRLAEVTFRLSPGLEVEHSERFAELYGWPTDKRLTLQELRAAYHPDDLERVMGERTAILEGGQDFYEVQHRILRRDGEVRWLLGRGRVERAPDGAPVSVTAVYLDETERHQSEAALRRSEAHKSVLLELNSRISELSDPAEISFAAAEILARAMGVDRAGYGLIDPRRETITIERDWNAPGVRSLAGVLQFRDYGSYIENLKRGETVVIADAREDPRTAETAAALEGINARSFVNMPVTEEGSFVALLYLNHGERRDWTPDELGLIREVANVTRSAVERRRAEAALIAEKRALEILNEAGAVVAADTDLASVVQRITDAGVALTGAQFGAFFYNVLDDEGGSYMLYSISGVPAEAFSRFPMPRNTDVFAPTFAGEGIVRSDDITQDPRYGRHEPHHGMPEGHLPVRSYLAVPVRSRTGEVLGGLFFGHPEAGVFGEDAERGLGGLAGQAAVAIDNARLFQSAQAEIRQRLKAEAELQALNADLEGRVTDEVTQRLRTEEALRQSQKMETIGQLTGGVAHDFNNLLTPIVGALDLLRRRLGDDERAVRLTDGALQAADRARTLVQRLLAFSRRQHLQPKPVDVGALIRGMEDLVSRSLGPQIALTVEAAEGLPPALIDPNQLELAVLNLAVNARDAMPDGGALAISVASETDPDGLTPGDYLRVQVVDTGIGMDAATLARAVEPFFTTKGVGRGTGLGLSSVHGMAMQSGGAFVLDSTPGQGTTATLWLPAADGLVAEDPVREAPGQAASKTSATILLVDDEDLVRAGTAEMLGEAGYRVVHAASGDQALQMIRSGLVFQLLVTDYAMPGMTGSELAREVGELRPGTPVLMITGYANLSDIEAAGLPRLAKPFRQTDLAGAVAEMLPREDV